METLLKTEHLKKYYGRKRVVRAVDDVSLCIEKGRSLALIGESGSGKTTFGKLIACLEKPTGGSFCFNNTPLQGMKEKQLRPLRRNLQMVFQSSSGVFDPTYTIGDSIREVMLNYETLPAAELEDRVDGVLREVGLDPALKNRYVSQISGGQCQRANIARALILRPKLVICDEPVSSLDYSIRKQILILLNEIQEKNDVTYLLITHDLSNVPYLCQSVAIMYQGKVVEQLDHTDSLLQKVVHPYTKKLFDSIPVADPTRRTIGRGLPSVPTVARPAESGCAYQNRCERCSSRCREEVPLLREVEAGHLAACHSI